MLHDELKNLEIRWNMLFLKTKSSNKQQKHSGVLIPGGTHDDNSGLYKKVHQTRNDKNRLPWLE